MPMSGTTENRDSAAVIGTSQFTITKLKNCSIPVSIQDAA